MNLRNLRRQASRVASAFLIPDHHVRRPPGRVVWMSCHDVDRSMDEGDGRFSPLLESVRYGFDELGYAAINLTHPFAIFRSAQIKGGSTTLNRRVLRERIWGKIARTLKLGTFVPSHETDLYRSLLASIDPSLVLCIQPPYTLCQAARELGILVVEVLHGTNYSLDNKLFGVDSDHMNRNDLYLPHVLLTFDDVSQQTMSQITKGRDIEAVQIAHPWLHLLRLEQARDIPRKSVAKPSRPRREQVLISLQWGYDGEREALSGIIPNGVVHPELEKVLALGAQRFRFLVRLHPIQMTEHGYAHHRSYIRSVAERYPNVEWEYPTSAPLPLLLDQVCAHITMSSSSVGEAAAVGIPSLTLCPTLLPGGAHDTFFRGLAEKGLVTFGTLDSTSILAWLDAQASRDLTTASYDAEAVNSRQLTIFSSLLERADELRLVAGRNPSQAEAA